MKILPISQKEEQSSLTRQEKKFVKRSDLTPAIRLGIASLALLFSPYGTITHLAASYRISRSFVYNLKAHLKSNSESLFGIVSTKVSKIPLLSMLFQLRLTGKCSLSATSTILGNLGYTHTSVGYLSETLDKYGSHCENVVNWQGSCVAASDEIFYMGHSPILVTVEVTSHCILSIQRLENLTKEGWLQNWAAIKAQGISFRKLITDEGTVIQSALPSLDNEEGVQSDTYHAVAHKLGVFYARLEQQVQKDEAFVQAREIRYFGTKTEQMANEVYEQYLQGLEKVEKSKALAADFKFLYACMCAQFKVFSLKDAQLRSSDFARQEMKAAIDLMRSLPIDGLKKHLDLIEKLIPHLFDFLDTAQRGVQQIALKIDQTALPFWCRAWQFSKLAYKTKGDYQKQKYYFDKMNQDLEILKNHYQDTPNNFDDLALTTFSDLDLACAQSSAAVENVNAFIRPFIQDCRGQISQNTLNLIMFYHNHKPFDRGKRKGFAPIELLTGSKLSKSWIELLLDKVP